MNPLKFCPRKLLADHLISAWVSRRFWCSWCSAHILILIWVYIQAILHPDTAAVSSALKAGDVPPKWELPTAAWHCKIFLQNSWIFPSAFYFELTHLSRNLCKPGCSSSPPELSPGGSFGLIVSCALIFPLCRQPIDRGEVKRSSDHRAEGINVASRSVVGPNRLQGVQKRFGGWEGGGRGVKPLRKSGALSICSFCSHNAVCSKMWSRRFGDGLDGRGLWQGGQGKEGGYYQTLI